MVSRQVAWKEGRHLASIEQGIGRQVAGSYGRQTHSRVTR